LAPVNPADINTVQGVYPIKPSLPGTPGSEGIAEVIAVGPEAKNLKLGDKVIPNKQPASTWRTHANVNESDVFKVRDYEHFMIFYIYRVFLTSVQEISLS
jgi:trans-2-enoyl-CoA reductase